MSRYMNIYLSFYTNKYIFPKECKKCGNVERIQGGRRKSALLFLASQIYLFIKFLQILARQIYLFIYLFLEILARQIGPCTYQPSHRRIWKHLIYFFIYYYFLRLAGLTQKIHYSHKCSLSFSLCQSKLMSYHNCGWHERVVAMLHYKNISIFIYTLSCDDSNTYLSDIYFFLYQLILLVFNQFRFLFFIFIF